MNRLLFIFCNINLYKYVIIYKNNIFYNINNINKIINIGNSSCTLHETIKLFSF